MKLNGKKLDARATAVVKLPRPGRILEFTIHSYPLGWDADDYIPLPLPPLTPKRIKGEIVRDADGTPVLLPDEDNPEYIAKRNHMQRLRTVVAFYFAVKDDPNAVFETMSETPPHGKVEPWKRLQAELKEAGLTTGDLAHVTNRAMTLSNLMEVLDVDGYMADFSPKGKPQNG